MIIRICDNEWRIERMNEAILNVTEGKIPVVANFEARAIFLDIDFPKENWIEYIRSVVLKIIMTDKYNQKDIDDASLAYVSREWDYVTELMSHVAEEIDTL